MSKFPNRLSRFVDEATWIFAKTYVRTWPHEYIVKDRVDDALFVELVRHIRVYGYVGKFYERDITYFEDRGKVYWTVKVTLFPDSIYRERVAVRFHFG